MRILPITREQFSDWLAMRRALYTSVSDAFHREEMESIFASDHMFAFLARDDDGRVIGMLELSLRNLVDGCLGSPVGYIEGIYVGPEYRGQGYARQLVEFAESWFRDRGCHDMATDAELDNAAAQSFHRAVGFEETYRIVEYRKPLG